MSISERVRKCRRTLVDRNQQHVLRFWDELDETRRTVLVEDIESIPWAVVDRLIATHVLSTPRRHVPAKIEPARVHPSAPPPDRATEYDEARRVGREYLAAGKVGAFTVAGGQGTRLGIDGPKGCVPATPVGDITLFEIFAQMVRAARDKYGTPIPWYIMTSPVNDAQTRAFFAQHDHFGLPADAVMFFAQGVLPAFDFEGKLLLSEKHRLALAPDGHGGSLKALVASGALSDMQRHGVEIISYFQVDNPLVRPFDPLFVGLHATTGSQMSTKVTPKADALERVGNLCVADGKVTVIEYSDLPESLAHAKNDDGSRRFDAANLAVHLIDVAFVDQIITQSFDLPFRRAEKIVPHINPHDGTRVEPDRPNAVKLEAFVFDALPLARKPVLLEVDRKEEFSPVKNATGTDSLETSHRDQVSRSCRWLEAAGVTVPRTSDGAPNVTVCITASFALDAEDVAGKLDQIPTLTPGTSIILQ